MKPRLGLVAVLVALAVVGTLFGPFLFRLLFEDLPAQYRGMRELIRGEQFRRDHPPELPFAQMYPDVILRVAMARTVQVYRLDPMPDSACMDRGQAECLAGHRVLGEVTVPGMKWGSRFILEIMRMATIPRVPTDRAIERLTPRIGMRFIGADSTHLLVDTDSLLVDSPDSIRMAVMIFAWDDSLGRPHRTVARMPFPFEGNPDADSTLQLLRHIPQPIDPVNL